MSTEVMTIAVEPPEAVVIPRLIEVRCGDSYVTVRQVMGRGDHEWTVYQGDGKDRGLVGKVEGAPTVATSEALIPWACDLVTRVEREKLAHIELRRKLGKTVPPNPFEEHVDQPATDQG